MASRTRSVCDNSKPELRLSQLRRPRARHVLDHSGQVQNQNHPSVAKNGGAGNQIGLESVVVQSFDDQFFFTFQRVDNQSVLPLAYRNDQHKELGVAFAFATGRPSRSNGST